jgi:hypothetical protein
VRPAFKDGRDDVLFAGHLFASRKHFNRVMRVGFGLCLEEDAGQAGTFAMDPASIARRFPYKQNAVYNALSYSDRYVWTWHGQWNEWEGQYPKDQLEAYASGRSGPTPMQYAKLPADAPHVKMAPKATTQKGYDDKTTFNVLMAGRKVLLDLPKAGWAFKIDPEERGVAEKWFARGFDAKDWGTIEIGKFWEEQGWDYDGDGWYRISFDLPALPEGKRIMLAVGAADSAAMVWLNGKAVGTYDMGDGGWDRPFAFDITDVVYPAKNTLVIKVHDRSGPGGLWKSVRVVYEE